MFRTPQIVLFTERMERATSFYQALGFREVFRTPSEGDALHVDLMLDGYRIGLATGRSTRQDHGLTPVVSGQRAAVILWTDDTPSAFARLVDLGALPCMVPAPGSIDYSSPGWRILTDT